MEGSMGDDSVCTIGTGIQVRGHLTGSGNLVVDGRVEGHIVLQAHVIVEQAGRVIADVETQQLTVRGKMAGNTTATQRVSVSRGATLVGDLRAPRIVLEDGAHFHGNIEMDVPLPPDI
jgi:cytoskeletal protein CcmA (bactofilin family)